MGDHISTDKGFMDHFVESRVESEGFLSRVDNLLDWSPIEKLLKKHLDAEAVEDIEEELREARAGAVLVH